MKSSSIPSLDPEIILKSWGFLLYGWREKSDFQTCDTDVVIDSIKHMHQLSTRPRRLAVEKHLFSRCLLSIKILCFCFML